MPQQERFRLSREIAAFAHGKALYCLSPVLLEATRDQKEAVFLHVAEEYGNFAEYVERLLQPISRENARLGGHGSDPS